MRRGYVSEKRDTLNGVYVRTVAYNNSMKNLTTKLMPLIQSTRRAITVMEIINTGGWKEMLRMRRREV